MFLGWNDADEASSARVRARAARIDTTAQPVDTDMFSCASCQRPAARLEWWSTAGSRCGMRSQVPDGLHPGGGSRLSVLVTLSLRSRWPALPAFPLLHLVVLPHHGITLCASCHYARHDGRFALEQSSVMAAAPAMALGLLGDPPQRPDDRGARRFRSR